jgi:hypothetical protein
LQLSFVSERIVKKVPTCRKLNCISLETDPRPDAAKEFKWLFQCLALLAISECLSFWSVNWRESGILTPTLFHHAFNQAAGVFEAEQGKESS